MEPLMAHTQDNASSAPGVSTVPRSTEVRVAQVNRKVVLVAVAVAVVVVALSFVSIVIHGLVLKGEW